MVRHPSTGIWDFFVSCITRGTGSKNFKKGAFYSVAIGMNRGVTIDPCNYIFQVTIDPFNYIFQVTIDSCNYIFQVTIDPCNYIFQVTIDSCNYILQVTIDPCNYIFQVTIDPCNYIFQVTIDPCPCFRRSRSRDCCPGRGWTPCRRLYVNS